ncbi:MAG TPA: Ig-like domain-containing protein [Gemmatimonadaceae bacterium]
MPHPAGARRVAALLALGGMLVVSLSCGGGGSDPVDPGGDGGPGQGSGGNGPGGGTGDGGGAAPSTRVSPELDTLTYVNAAARLTAARADGVAASFFWSSSDTSVAVVSQTGRVRATGRGSAFIVAGTAGATPDTARVVVEQRIAQVEVSPSSASRSVGRSFRFTARVLDAGGTAIPDAIVSWSAGERVTVDSSGLATAAAVGTDTIRAVAGGFDGRATLAVSPAPTIRVPADTLFLGVGQTSGEVGTPIPTLAVIVDSLEADEPVTLAMANSDGSVAAATLEVADRTYEESGIERQWHALQLVGRQAGTARLTFSAPRFQSATVVVRVTAPRLEGGDSVRITLNPMYGSPPQLVVRPADSLGHAHASTTDLTIVASSTNPAVVRLQDGPLVVPAGADGATLPLVPEAAGRARIVLAAPGYRPDTVVVDVIAEGPRFQEATGQDRPAVVVGAGQLSLPGSVYVRWPVSAPGGSVVTFTQRRPDLVRFPASAVMDPLEQYRARIDFAGLAPGVDTVVASLPGYVSDTLIVHVSRPRLAGVLGPHSAGAPFYVTQPPGMTIRPVDSLGVPHDLVQPPLVLRASSSNPAVLSPAAATLSVADARGASQPLHVLGPGVAVMTYEDVDGRYAPFVSAPITVGSARLTFGVDGVPSFAIVTPPELSPRYGYLVRIRLVDHTGTVRAAAEPLTVQLSSTNPEVLGIPTPTITLAPGEMQSGEIPVVAYSQGMAAIVVSDPRTGPGRYDPVATPLLFVQPRP